MDSYHVMRFNEVIEENRRRQERFVERLVRARARTRGGGVSALEYVEASSADELRRLRDAPQLTDEEVANVDLEELCERLLA